MVKCTKREVRKLRTALRWKLAALQRQRIQMVLLRESGVTQPAIAEAMGVSLSTVNRARMAYDQGGLEALRPLYLNPPDRAVVLCVDEKS
jgi:transposase